MSPAAEFKYFLKWAVFFVFAGRAWQHLFRDVPVRELLWDARLMKPLIENLTSMNWREYVTHPAAENLIGVITGSAGIYYGICALAVLFFHRLPSFFRFVIAGGGLGLVFLAFLYTKQSFFHLGQFFEYALQFGSPFFFLYTTTKSQVSTTLIFWVKVAIALTFACHGLYALGVYPRPVTFYTMTMHTLGLSESAATVFLNIAGIMDLVVASGVFLPQRLIIYPLLYATVWGFLTAAARVTGFFYLNFPIESLLEGLPEMLYRLPHGLVPLATLCFLEQRVSKLFANRFQEH